MNDDNDDIRAEEEYNTELVKILAHYDNRKINIIECAEKSRTLAKRIAAKHTKNLIEGNIYITEDIERYETMKWVGWKEIEKRYLRDEDDFSEEDKTSFGLLKISYIVENDL